MPLASLHLQLPVNTLELLEKGDGKLELSASWANSFLLARSFLVDAETYQLSLGGWYAIASDFHVGAEVPFLARDSGVLDPLIDGIHETFHFGDGDRGERGRNEYEIRVDDPGGRSATLDRGVGLGDLVLKANWNVHPGGGWYPAVSMQGLLGLPTSTNGFGSSGVDVGLMISFFKNVLDVVHLYASVGGCYLTDSSTQGLHYERESYLAVAGAEIPVTGSLSLIVQTMNYSPLLERPSPLNKKRNYLAAGLKWEYLDGFTVELSVVENLYPFTSSADIAFAATLGFRL